MPRAKANGKTGPSAKWLARRELIVDTSARIFARQGYHATGLNDLCEANDLGKGALYHYIRSKEALLAAIHDRVLEEVMRGAERAVGAGGTPSEQLTRLGDELLGVIHHHPDHVWVFLHELGALTGELGERFRDRRKEYERQVEDVLRAGVASGEFRDMDPWLMSRAWLGMHNYAYLWLRPGHRLAVPDVASSFASIFLQGIRGPAADPAAGR